MHGNLSHLDKDTLIQHILTSVGNYEVGNKRFLCDISVIQVMLCKEHVNELKYYYETCEELVYLYCTVKEHNGHNHDTVKKIANKQRSELKDITAPVEGIIEAHDKITDIR